MAQPPPWNRPPQGQIVWSRATPRLELGRFHEGLGALLLGLLGIVGLIDLVDLGLTLYRLALSQWGPPDPFRTYDLINWTRSLEGWHVKVCLGVALAWIIWQTMAAASSRVPREALCYHPFWHATSWFIPVVGFVMPLQNMADLRWAAEYPLAESEHQQHPARRITGLLLGWWISWLLCIPTLVFSVSYLPYAFLDITPDVGTTVEAAMDVVQIVNDVLAMVVVGEVFFRLRIQRRLDFPPMAPTS